MIFQTEKQLKEYGDKLERRQQNRRGRRPRRPQESPREQGPRRRLTPAYDGHQRGLAGCLAGDVRRAPVRGSGADGGQGLPRWPMARTAQAAGPARPTT
ncbi:MAG: hypothetical protein WKG07_01015 [Hymenobacter sp.]